MKLMEAKDMDSDPKFQMGKEVRDKRFLVSRSRRGRTGGIIQPDHNKEDGNIKVIYKKEKVMRTKKKPTETVSGRIVQAIMNWDQVLEELIDNGLISDSDSMELTIPNMTLYLQNKFPDMRKVGPRFSEVSCALESLEILSKVKRGGVYICSVDSDKLGQLSFDQLYEIVIGRVNTSRDERIKKKLEEKLEGIVGKRKDTRKKLEQPEKEGKQTKSLKRIVKVFEGQTRITEINIGCNDNGISLEIRFKE